VRQSLLNIYYLGVKELFSLGRDAVLMLLILYAFTYGIVGPAKGVSMDMKDASIAIVDEDHSQISARIRDAFLPPFFLKAAQISADAIDASMDAGRYTFVVDVPPDFQRDVKSGRRASVQVNVDATAMAQAGRGASYIESILAQELSGASEHSGEAEKAPVNFVIRTRFNPNLTYSWFMAISELVNHTTLIAMLLCGAAVIREREHGTLEHLLVMPLRPIEIMLAKMLANGVVVVLVTMLSLLLVIRWWLEVSVAGSLSLFLLGTALYVLAVSALGIFLATLVRSMPQFGLLIFPVFIIMTLLSGGTTPMDSMPETLQQIMRLSPSTHFVSFAQAVLFRGAGLDIVWRHCIQIMALGLMFFGVALRRFRRVVARAQTA